MNRLTGLMVAAGLLIAQSAVATPPLTIFATVAMQAAITELEPSLSVSAGMPVVVRYGSTAALVDSIVRGEVADVVLLTDDAVRQPSMRDRLSQQTILLSSAIGVAVADSAKTPVLRTREDLAVFLKNTPSIAYSARGASGLYIAQLVETLHLSEIVLPKATIVAEGSTATLLRDGKVAAAVQMVSELKFADAKNIVALPAAIAPPTLFSVATVVAGSNPVESQKIIKLLQSGRAAASYVEAGLNPLFTPAD